MFLERLRNTATIPHILQHSLIRLGELRQKLQHVVQFILGNNYDAFEWIGEDDVALRY